VVEVMVLTQVGRMGWKQVVELFQVNCQKHKMVEKEKTEVH
jgi:hypothetical protein